MLKNKILLFLFVFILDLIFNFITSELVTWLWPQTYEIAKGTRDYSGGLYEELFVNTIWIPVFETLLFQVLPIEILNRIFNSPRLAIVVSAILFSLSHYYNWVYIVAVLPAGLLYASYYSYLKKAGITKAFLSVTAIHALSNLCAFMINHFT